MQFFEMRGEPYGKEEGKEKEEISIA